MEPKEYNLKFCLNHSDKIVHRKGLCKSCYEKQLIGIMKGLKDDGLDGSKPVKLRWDLIPIGCVEDLAKVLTYGAVHYKAESWKELEDAENRYYAALMRHLSAYRQGQLTDEESGLSHLAHAMCNVVFLLWFEKHKTKNNGEN